MKGFLAYEARKFHSAMTFCPFTRSLAPKLQTISQNSQSFNFFPNMWRRKKHLVTRGDEITTPLSTWLSIFLVSTGPQGYSSCGTWWHTRRNQILSFPEPDESISIGGGVSSVDCWQPRCAHQLELCWITTFGSGVRILATHSIRQFPLHFPSRASKCATRFRTNSTAVLIYVNQWMRRRKWRYRPTVLPSTVTRT